MSMRLRLTLLYSAILAATLIGLGLGIYSAVSDVTFGAARDAVTAEARVVAVSLQPHLGPCGDRYGQQGAHPGAPPQPLDQGCTAPPGGGQAQDLGAFVPPPDVAAQNAIQVRSLSGAVLYRSSDLQATKLTLPLGTAARRGLRPGTTALSTVSVGTQRLLLASTLVSSHGVSVAILQVARSLHDVDGTLTTPVADPARGRRRRHPAGVRRGLVAGRHRGTPDQPHHPHGGGDRGHPGLRPPGGLQRPAG